MAPLPEVAPPRSDLESRLEAKLDGWVADPAAYDARVRRECRQFPEGDLFPYTLPAMAWAQQAFADPTRRDRSLARMAPLLERAVTATASKVGAPGNDLTRLAPRARQGTYLGQLDLALASFRLAGGDDRFEPVRRHVADLLADALAAESGGPIHSFPSYTWTFDTIPALVALAADDRLAGTHRAAPLVTAHLRWIRDHGTDRATGLPASRVRPDGRPLDGPRGCDLSWRVALLSQLDREQAAALYRRYVTAHWLERGALSGFAEWPGGRAGREDADSGPLYLGIGSTATALGLAAARSTGDEPRRARLEAQVETVRSALALAPPGIGLGGGRIDVRPEYVTGFLYGDVVLFYAATWRPWPDGSRP